MSIFPLLLYFRTALVFDTLRKKVFFLLKNASKVKKILKADLQGVQDEKSHENTHNCYNLSNAF